MQKKAQISQIIVYLFIALVLVATVLFGYRLIKGMKHKAEIAELTKFETDLKSDIESVGRGSTVFETYYVPIGFREVCFFDYKADPFLAEAAYDPIVNDAYYGQVKENVFLVSNDPPVSYYIHSLKLTKPIDCVKVAGNKFELKLEGKGAATVISG